MKAYANSLKSYEFESITSANEVLIILLLFNKFIDKAKTNPNYKRIYLEVFFWALEYIKWYHHKLRDRLTTNYKYRAANTVYYVDLRHFDRHSKNMIMSALLTMATQLSFNSSDLSRFVDLCVRTDLRFIHEVQILFIVIYIKYYKSSQRLNRQAEDNNIAFSGAYSQILELYKPRHSEHKLLDEIKLTCKIIECGDICTDEVLIDSLISKTLQLINGSGLIAEVDQQAAVLQFFKMVNDRDPNLINWENYYSLFTKVAVIKLFEYSQEALFDYCCIVVDHMWFHFGAIKSQLQMIVTNENVTIRLYNKINDMLQMS